MEIIEIKQATIKDTNVLVKIGRETFYETFAADNSEENMRDYLERSFNREKITSELEDAGAIFFIAWLEDQPIGYLKVNRGASQTELQDNSSLEIERIYVKAAFYGKKVGQLLYDKALDVAQQAGMSSIWLGVWEKNPRAIRFYEKNGFIAFDQHIFKMGAEDQIDIMMRKHL